MDQKKPNCYDCRWRTNAPGSGHSCCTNPRVDAVQGVKASVLAQMFLCDDRSGPVQLGGPLAIQAHPQGLARGWFLWPVNFDPTWLVACTGFEAWRTLLERNEEVDRG